MNVFRREGLGWAAAALCALGAIIVIAGALDIPLLSAVPTVVGLVALAVGVIVIVAGFFAGRETTDPAPVEEAGFFDGSESADPSAPAVGLFAGRETEDPNRAS
jgi:hypothetical protein